MLEMHTRDGVPVFDALALMAQEGGIGTFQAIRRSLAEDRRRRRRRSIADRAGHRVPPPAPAAMSTNGHVGVCSAALNNSCGCKPTKPREHCRPYTRPAVRRDPQHGSWAASRRLTPAPPGSHEEGTSGLDFTSRAQAAPYVNVRCVETTVGDSLCPVTGR
jgi:hypothetical protein